MLYNTRPEAVTYKNTKPRGMIVCKNMQHKPVIKVKAIKSPDNLFSQTSFHNSMSDEMLQEYIIVCKVWLFHDIFVPHINYNDSLDCHVFWYTYPFSPKDEF